MRTDLCRSVLIYVGTRPGIPLGTPPQAGYNREWSGVPSIRRTTVNTLRATLILVAALAGCGGAEQAGKEKPMFETDVIQTSAGDLAITSVGHGTLQFAFGGKIIHVDPVSREADYTQMPKADLILVTHDHGDHLDPEAIAAVRKDGTPVVVAPCCAAKFAGGTVMKNGDTKTIAGLTLEAVPAYNLVHERSPGNPFHPKGAGNGYIIAFGDKRVYVAGDTENTPEMRP